MVIGKPALQISGKAREISKKLRERKRDWL